MQVIKIENKRQQGKRLDHFLVNLMNAYTRSKIQAWINDGRILVNGKKCKTGYWLDIGDIIHLEIPNDNQFNSNKKLVPEEMELDIIYEDNHIIILNKPSGMVVHPGIGIDNGTLVNGLLNYFDKLSRINDDNRPGIVHRLDKLTSGLLIVAKTNDAHVNLSNQFKRREIKKEYIGVTWGNWLDSSGEINKSISRSRKNPTKNEVHDKGKISFTAYKVKKDYKHCSLVHFFPKTGRTHQIRVHSSYKGNPIFGDEKYGGGIAKTKGFLPEFNKIYLDLLRSFGRHALHASRLNFIHPYYKEKINFKAPLPKEFLNLINALDNLGYVKL